MATAKKKQPPKYIGAHMPIAGGVEKAPGRAKEVGCTALQIFSKNASQWKAKPLEDDAVQLFKENLADAGIDPRAVAVHDSYLINLGTPDGRKRGMALTAFVDEIKRSHTLGVPYLVFHPGSHLGEGDEKGLALVAESMNKALDKTKDCDDVSILIETTAGQGTNLGYTFDHIAYLIDNVKDKKRVGVCVDTCHIFAAGYELRTRDGYNATFKEFDEKVGLDWIKFFHVNDSKKDFGSKVDRHEHIGEGFLGLEPFRFLMNDKRFAEVPMSLETPKGKDFKEDVKNLETLRGLAG